MPLDPQHITPSVSLNRVRLIDLPGLEIDPQVKRQTGYQLVSSMALTRLVRQSLGALQLDPNLGDHELHLALDRCFAGEQATVRAAAESIGRRMGRNMGYLLLVLKRGDEVNRAARDEWDDSDWRHWSEIEQVWLGGGLVSGRLGPLIKQHASAVMKEAGLAEFKIDISSYGSVLPLVGVARCAPPGCQAALVFDFGSTAIKCALAVFKDNQLVELCRLPSYLTGWERIAQASDDLTQQAAQLLSHMVSIIVDTHRTAHQVWTKQTRGLYPLGSNLGSVATYIRDGHPPKNKNRLLYVQLRRVTQNLQDELARRVSAQLGQAVDVRLVHDGTAAAMAYAGAAHTAVITVGTALGIGFPPQVDHLLAISTEFRILDCCDLPPFR